MPILHQVLGQMIENLEAELPVAKSRNQIHP